MSSRPNLGIDFGTSHTVAMLSWPDGRVRPLLFDGTPLLPSSVYADPTANGTLLTGRDALHAARVHPECFESTPKRRIDDGSVLLGATEFTVTQLICAVLTRVADEAKRVIGGDPGAVVLSHPAAWGVSRRLTLVEACKQAGLGEPRLIPEPEAAARYFVHALGHKISPNEGVLIYDFGGGTFDASLVTFGQNGFDVSAVDGIDDLGGVDLDELIVNYLKDQVAEEHPAAWQRLAAPSTPEDLRNHRMLWDDARVTKERLSRAASTTVHVPIAGVDVTVTREAFEQRARPLLEQTVRTSAAVRKWTGLSENGLIGIFLVGGSSRIPLVSTLLERDLGIAPTAIEQPELVVAEGILHSGGTAAGTPAGGIAAGSPSAAPTSGPGAPAANSSMSAPPASAPPMSVPPMSGPPMSVPPMAGPPMSAPPVSPQPPGQQPGGYGAAPAYGAPQQPQAYQQYQQPGYGQHDQYGHQDPYAQHDPYAQQPGYGQQDPYGYQQPPAPRPGAGASGRVYQSQPTPVPVPQPAVAARQAARPAPVREAQPSQSSGGQGSGGWSKFFVLVLVIGMFVGGYVLVNKYFNQPTTPTGNNTGTGTGTGTGGTTAKGTTSGKPNATRPSYKRKNPPEWLPKGWQQTANNTVVDLWDSGPGLPSGGYCNADDDTLKVTGDSPAQMVACAISKPGQLDRSVANVAVETDVTISRGCAGIWPKTGNTGYFLIVCDRYVRLHALGKDPVGDSNKIGDWPIGYPAKNSIVGVLISGQEITVYYDGVKLGSVTDSLVNRGKPDAGGYSGQDTGVDVSISSFRVYTDQVS